MQERAMCQSRVVTSKPGIRKSPSTELLPLYVSLSCVWNTLSWNVLPRVVTWDPLGSKLSSGWESISCFLYPPSLHPYIREWFERMKQRPYKCLKTRNSVKGKEKRKREERINPQIPAHARAFLFFFPTSKESESNKSPFKTTWVKMKLCVFHILQNRLRDENEGEFPIVKHAQK